MASRKLAGAIAGMLAVVGIAIGGTVVGATSEVILATTALVAGLGGYQVARQAHIDEEG